MPEPPTLALSQDFIHARYGNRAGRLTLLGAGEWSRAYVFTLAGAEAVVRFGAHGDDFAKDQIMAGFGASTLPIPRTHGGAQSSADGVSQGTLRATSEFAGWLVSRPNASTSSRAVPTGA